MIRVTQKQVYNTFKHFCNVASKTRRDEIPEEDRRTEAIDGTWDLKRTPGAGYSIEQARWVNNQVVYSLPFGMQCMQAREFVSVMRFACAALHVLGKDRLVIRQREIIDGVLDALRPDISDVVGVTYDGKMKYELQY